MGTFGPKTITGSAASATDSLMDRDADIKKILKVPSDVFRVITEFGVFNNKAPGFTSISIWRETERVYGPINAQHASAFDPEKVTRPFIAFPPGSEINIEMINSSSVVASADIYLVYEDVQ